MRADASGEDIEKCQITIKSATSVNDLINAHPCLLADSSFLRNLNQIKKGCD